LVLSDALSAPTALKRRSSSRVQPLRAYAFLASLKPAKSGLATAIPARAERLKRHANMRFTIRFAGLGGQATKPEI